MAQYINKYTLVAKIKDMKGCKKSDWHFDEFDEGYKSALEDIFSFLDTLEVKEVGLTDKKIDWSPSKKQMKSLHDLLKYNIGVFDYQKFMEVNSLYDNLTKILDYETDKQK